MIDHEAEKLIPFETCGSLIPGNPDRSTLYRWTLKGIRGAKLESLLVGNKRFTSREAIARFISAQNADETKTPPKITAGQRRRLSEAARESLSADFGV